MNILITGVAGFIGFHLASELLKKKYNIIGVDNLNDYYSPKYKNQRLSLLRRKKKFRFLKIDLKKKKDLDLVFKKFKPKVIYHLASQPGIMYSFKNPKTYITNNIDVTQNLIEQSLKNKVEKFYFTSSSSVYGNKKKFPITEKNSLKPINTYAKTKQQCEKILLRKFKNTDVDLKIFRPFTVYGPYARPDMIFITYLKKVMSNEIFFLYNYGNYVRDFTYVDDLVKILSKFLKVNKIKNKIFNICSSKPIKVKKLINIINKKITYKPNIILKPYRNGEMKKTYGDNKLLKKTINFKKFTTIENGITKTLDWYEKFNNKNILYFNKVKYK